MGGRARAGVSVRRAVAIVSRGEFFTWSAADSVSTPRRLLVYGESPEPGPGPLLISSVRNATRNSSRCLRVLACAEALVQRRGPML
jgi:hypothetical protein